MSPTPTNPRGAVDLSDLAAKAKQNSDATPGAAGVGGSYVTEVTEQNFEAEARKSLQHPVVVELYSPEAPSQQMSDALAQYATEQAGKFSVMRVNASTAPQLAQALAQAFGVQNIPALGGMLQGQPVGLASGMLNREQLEQVIGELIKAAVSNGIVGRAEPTGGAPADQAEDAEPDPRFAAADEALQRGDYAAAEAEFDKLLAANPKDAEAQAGKAQAGLLARTAEVNPQEVIARAAGPDATVDDQLNAADAEVAGGRAEEAFARLLTVIRTHAGEDKEQARVRLLELFETLGNSDPRVQKARRDLMAALF